MKNNLDKDIKLLKSYKNKLVYEISDKDKKAIENVLSELKTYREKIIHLSDEEYRKVIDNAQKDIKSELETYKKIAEKLAEEIYNVASSERCSCNRIIKNIYDYKPQIYNEKDGKKVALDWARKEVENDE